MGQSRHKPPMFGDNVTRNSAVLVRIFLDSKHPTPPRLWDECSPITHWVSVYIKSSEMHCTKLTQPGRQIHSNIQVFGPGFGRLELSELVICPT